MFAYPLPHHFFSAPKKSSLLAVLLLSSFMGGCSMVPAPQNNAYVGFVADYTPFDMGTDGESFGMPAADTYRQDRSRHKTRSARRAEDVRPSMQQHQQTGMVLPQVPPARQDAFGRPAVAAFHKTTTDFTPAALPATTPTPILSPAPENIQATTPAPSRPDSPQTRQQREASSTRQEKTARISRPDTGTDTREATKENPQTGQLPVTASPEPGSFELPREKKLFIWRQDSFEPAEKTALADTQKTKCPK